MDLVIFLALNPFNPFLNIISEIKGLVLEFVNPKYVDETRK